MVKKTLFLRRLGQQWIKIGQNLSVKSSKSEILI